MGFVDTVEGLAAKVQDIVNKDEEEVVAEEEVKP